LSLNFKKSISRSSFINAHNGQFDFESLPISIREKKVIEVDFENKFTKIKETDDKKDLYCESNERFNYSILSSDTSYYRRGYLVVKDNFVLGHIKFKGKRSFLSWNTLKLNSSYPLIFGGIYKVPKFLIDELEEKGKLKPNIWGIISLEKLSLNPIRLIEENPIFTHRRIPLCKKIIDERNLVNKILNFN